MDPRRSSGLDWLVALSGLVLFTVILCVGWFLGQDGLVRRSESSYAVMPSTALSFVLLFAVLAFADRKEDAGQRKPIWRHVGIFPVAAMALVNLSGRMLGYHSGVEELISLNAAREMGDGAVVSYFTAGGFLLAVLLMIHRFIKPLFDDWTGLSLNILLLSTALAILLGHGFEVHSLYGVPGFTGMSEFTALGFSVLFAGLLLRDRAFLSEAGDSSNPNGGVSG